MFGADILDFVLAMIVNLLAVGVVAVSLYRGVFKRYSYVNLYVAALLVFDLARYVFLQRYGFQSKQYFYAFYGTDAVLAVLLYLLILSVFDIVFRDSSLRGPVRVSLWGGFTLLCFISYLFIPSSAKNFYSHLLVEFQQNMYFASVVLTVMLCISLAHLRVRDPQLSLLVSGLGVFAAVQAGQYAILNLLPRNLFENNGVQEVTRRLPAVATAMMVGLWCYALWKLAATAKAPAESETIEVAEAGSREPELVFVAAAGRGRH